MKRFILTSTILTATGLIAAPGVAQQTYDLGTIVLSGGLTPVAADEYGRAATVLTAEDIEARGVTYAADALRAVPGVSVSRTGAFGALTQVRLRGHEANHALVLIDGVEVASPSTGEYDFSALLSAEIERIEVIRGPQSALYGSNAIGGVISITTKRASVQGTSGSVGVKVGSNGTTEGRLALRYKGEKGDISFSTARRESGGFDVSGTSGGEKDGDLNRSYNLNGKVHVSDTLTFGGTLRHTDRVSDDDRFNFGAATRSGLVTDSAATSKTQESAGSLFAELTALGGRWENRVDLSYAQIDRQGRDGARVPDQDNTGTRAKITYKGSFALDSDSVASADQIVTLGAEWERLTYKGNQAFFNPGELIKRSREQSAIVMEYQGSFASGFDLQGSVRHDFNDRFEDATTYALGVSYRFEASDTRIHASYGTGIQNPTLIEQFGFFSDFAGNPDLKPEESEGWDIGIEQEFLGGRGVVDVTYFSADLTNEITSVFDPATGISTPMNQAGKSDRQGIEVATSVALTERLDVALSYTWLDATDPGGAVEVRRPKHDATLHLGYLMPNDRTRLNLDVQRVAGLYDTDFTAPALGSTTVKLTDYTLVNMGFSHDMSDSVRLTGGMHNALDENYMELDGFATQGRTVYLGLTSTF